MNRSIEKARAWQQRSKRLRFRSRKTAALYVARRELVAEMLQDAPCGARLDGCTGTATEVHELLSRARGGDINDRENCSALCANCHRWITEHPAAALAMGWLRRADHGTS